MIWLCSDSNTAEIEIVTQNYGRKGPATRCDKIDHFPAILSL